MNNTEDNPVVYYLEKFIKQREELLSNRTLVNFKELETSHRTEIHGNIASRISHYEKSGELNGESFNGVGVKILQFIKTNNNKWILSSVVWSDFK
jgi:hypothetical protein